jgi:queuine tRNA-ribosyltransferase
MNSISLIHNKNLSLPAFFPDGTYGVVKAVDAIDVANAGVDGIVMNALHLSSKPGAKIIKTVGGINNFTGFKGPVLTDSGGFQVFSLIRDNKKYGEIRKKEIIFYPDMTSESKYIYTPQKCIQNQFAYKSDIIMCLDYCTHPNDPRELQEKSVETTVKWARLCKEEYAKQINNYKYTSSKRPLIFGIIQGGNYHDLRQKCAEELVGIGFDGFGFGGWPLDEKGNFLWDILKLTADLMPDNLLKYAMGVGRPEEIVKCVEFGYTLFDCVIPTREARHHRLYTFIDEIDREPFYDFVYIMDDKYINDTMPISGHCDCFCCKNFSRAFLRHLFKIGDSLACRLATIHNLRFYSMLMEKIRRKNGN